MCIEESRCISVTSSRRIHWSCRPCLDEMIFLTFFHHGSFFTDLHDCDLLIVEDIIDSGRTLAHLVRYLEDRGAKSVKTCTLLDKPSRREVEFVPDYCGVTIPDEFVIGYGLDYDQKYRNLPYISYLEG